MNMEQLIGTYRRALKKKLEEEIHRGNEKLLFEEFSYLDSIMREVEEEVIIENIYHYIPY